MDRASFDRVLAGARDVQDFLWGEAAARGYTTDTWLNILEKRIKKLRALDPTAKHAHVELRKRVLQITAVGLAWLENLGPLGPQADDVSDSAAGLSDHPGHKDCEPGDCVLSSDGFDCPAARAKSDASIADSGVSRHGARP